VIRTRATSVVRLPATTHSGCALASPDEIDYLRDNEAVRKQARFDAWPPGGPGFSPSCGLHALTRWPSSSSSRTWTLGPHVTALLAIGVQSSRSGGRGRRCFRPRTSMTAEVLAELAASVAQGSGHAV
jgi:hypothetical protein